MRPWTEATPLPARYRPGSKPLTIAPMACAEIKLANGDVLTIDGTVEEVERKLSDAARSGQSRLAWFVKHGTDESVGVNPDQVATLKATENPA